MGAGSIVTESNIMTFPAPFIHISALMRTGSTMLSEALTQLPRSFIFLEPYWGLNSFSVRGPVYEQLKAYDVDLNRFLRIRRPMAFLTRRLRPLGIMQDFTIREIKRALFPQLSAIGVQQVGVKEIKHSGWEHYVRHFPDMKMIMLGRDPRDLYISAYRKWEKGTTLWHGSFTPRSAAQQLNAQFLKQLKMRDHVECLEIRYEELCTNPGVVAKILSFTESPLDTVGEVGHFIQNHPKRRHEYLKHGNVISKQSVNRWKREPNRALADDAYTFACLMSQYTSFWDYDA